MELLAWDDSMARRAAAETLALMGLKIGDGYAVYLIQVLYIIRDIYTYCKKLKYYIPFCCVLVFVLGLDL